VPEQQEYKQPELLTVEEAAIFLRTTKSGIYGRIHRGTAPPYIRIGSSVRFLKSDLITYLELNRVESSQGSAQKWRDRR